MKKSPSHEAVIVQEYFHARIEVKNEGRQRTLGKECIGTNTLYYCVNIAHQIANKGRRLCDFCEENYLEMRGTIS